MPRFEDKHFIYISFEWKTLMLPEIRFNPNARALTWMAINLAIHAAIKALSRLRVRRVYRWLEELFCIDFLWFLCAHRGWPARDKSLGLVTCKSQIDERFSKYAYAALLVYGRARTVNALDMLAYFGQYLWVGSRSIESRRSGRSMLTRSPFAAPSWRTNNDAGDDEDGNASFGPPEAFICERNSESDRFAILRTT